MKFIIISIMKIYWKLFRPKTLGVKLLLINDDKVLLVEHSYTKGLFLPGGGVKTGEMFDQAVKREISEELGLRIEDLNLFGVYQSIKEGKMDTIVTFISTCPVDLNKIKLSNEISRAAFYNIGDLPSNISLGSTKRIQEYRSKNYPITKEW